MNGINASVISRSLNTLGADHHALLPACDTHDSRLPAQSSTQTAMTVAHEPATATAPGPAASAYLPRRPLTAAEASVCILAILAWVLFVAVGVAVPTKPYIDLMGNPGGTTTSFEFAKALFVILTCYTFTNIAALCCLSAVIGAIGRSARIDDVERNDPATDLRTLCISAVIRGFFMFVVILSGTLVLSDQKFDNISIEQYLKLTGLVSLLSFAIGYDPRLFVTFFERVSQLTNNARPQPAPQART